MKAKNKTYYIIANKKKKAEQQHALLWILKRLKEKRKIDSQNQIQLTNTKICKWVAFKWIIGRCVIFRQWSDDGRANKRKKQKETQSKSHSEMKTTNRSLDTRKNPSFMGKWHVCVLVTVWCNFFLSIRLTIRFCCDATMHACGTAWCVKIVKRPYDWHCSLFLFVFRFYGLVSSN